MPRSVSTVLQSLLIKSAVESQSTLELIYSDGTIKHLATTNFSDGKNDYVGDLRRVGDISQSLTVAADRVSVSCQNIDRTFGADVASVLRKLDNATAIIGRFYRDIQNPLNFAHRTLFRGKVANATADELSVTFDVISEPVAAGVCVAMRTLSENCSFRYKTDLRCGATSTEAVCNKIWKSKGGCIGRDNAHRFGGFTFPNPPTPTTPGSGGNLGGISGGGYESGNCFSGDTLIWCPKGDVPIRDLSEGSAVFAFNEKTLEIERCFVTRKNRHVVARFYEFEFSTGEKLIVTPEHLIFVGGTFLPADKLRLREKVWTQQLIQAKTSSFSNISQIRFYGNSLLEVFSLEVSKLHTHFANGIAVHNAKDWQIQY
jgi:hypothetical protein